MPRLGRYALATMELVGATDNIAVTADAQKRAAERTRPRTFEATPYNPGV